MIKKISSFKIILSIIFSLVLTFIPANTFANDNQESQSIASTPIEEEMDDITKRFILAAFGKQALIWFAVDTELNYMTEIEDAEITEFSRPFNKNNFSMLQSYIIISLTVGFAIFSIYLFWIIKEGIIKGQQSGQFLGQNWSTLFTVTKIGIVTTLLFPIYTPYSVGHMLIFKTLGYSNVIAKEINNTIISHQPKTYPTVKFPAAGAKKRSAESIIAFLTCAKAQDTTGSLQLNFYRKEGKIEASSDFGECNITYKLGFDEGTKRIIEENKKVKEALDISIDFEQIQIIMLRNLVEETLKLADQSSDLLFLPYKQTTVNTRRGVRGNGNAEPVEFNKYTLEHTPNKLYTTHWEGMCDEIFNFKALNPDVTELNTQEKEQYIYLSSRCISYEIAKRLVYPTEINDFSKYLKTQNYLKENEIEVCGHEYSEINGLRARAIIEESDITGEETLSELEQTVRTNVNIKSISIKECLKSQCSNLTSDYSNAYMCSNVISLYDRINKNNRMSETGFLTLGAYMYELFSASKINENAKKIFNGFEATYAEDRVGSTYNSPESLFTVNYQFNPVLTNNQLSRKNKELVESTVISSYQPIFEKRRTQEEGVSSLFNFASNGEMDLLGSKRFTTCMKNSLKIENGYSCGSVPEEMNNFGRNLFEYGVYVKTMLAVYQSLYGTVDIIRKSNEVDAGIKNDPDNTAANDKNEDKNKKTQKKKKNNLYRSMAISLIALIPGASSEVSDVMSDFTIDIVGKELTETDDFGNLTTTKVENQLTDITTLSANGIAIFAAWTTDSFIGELIGLFINLLIFVGLIFAYIIPLIPLYLWMMVIIGWFLLLFETIAILPIWIPTLTTPTENNTSEMEKKGLSMILKLFLKAPLLCMGVLTAWIITNTVISKIMGYLNFEKIFSIEYGYSVSSMIDSVILMFAYCIFLWYIINITITIIEAFYEFATNWLTGSPSSRVYGKDVTSGFLQRGSAQRQTMRVLNPLKKGLKKKQ